MAKKIKALNHGSKEPKPLNAQDGKLGPIRTYEDVADSEDEFHINRDKVLLDDGPDAKRRKKWEEEDALLEPSDEEILGYSTSEDEDDVEANEAASKSKPRLGDELASDEPDENEEHAEGWGPSKRDYYNADNIETEADALEEEAEARRLQQKRLEKMSDADFGFDADEWLGTNKADDDGDVVTEVLKDVEITADMSPAEKLTVLRTRYPEFDSIADQFLVFGPLLQKLQVEVNMKVSEKKRAPPVAVAELRALSAYVCNLTMYFVVLTVTAEAFDSKSVALDPIQLRDHTVIESLLHCRNLWSKLTEMKAELANIPEEAELSDADVEIVKSKDESTSSPTQKPEPRRTKKERARDIAAAEAARSHAQRKHASEAEMRDLIDIFPLVSKYSKPSQIRSAAVTDSESDFGEEESLSPSAVAEKAAKKKSLRFYTSQIAQKANRRADAGRDAGGDTDVPYRERLRDRQARLNAEAEKRGKKLDEYGRGAALGTDENADEDASEAEVAKAVRGDGDEYYDFVVRSSRHIKDTKAKLRAAVTAFTADGEQERAKEGEVGADGKRAIGYVIEKNKGLAPKRSKDVRNPRVKKRKKYEERKKKLASMKPVYTGGEGRGGYGGEKTGIKTGLVKSIKL